jgi:hypothetical protein
VKSIDNLKRETKTDLEMARLRRLDRDNPLGAAMRDMEAAVRNGSIYVSPLDPPPGDLRAAHGAHCDCPYCPDRYPQARIAAQEHIVERQRRRAQ